MKTKKQVIEDFRQHVNSGKVAFYEKYNMDLVMGRREGIRFWDAENDKSYINLHCNGGVFNLGHRHPEIISTLQSALELFDIGNHHLISSARAEAARLLSDLMPGDLNYVVFGVSGGEATDTAIKIARGYTRREKIISAKGGYHGHTGLALATGDEKYRLPFGKQLPGFVQVPFGNIDELKKEINQDTAAVIMETIPATLGMPIPSVEYMKGIRQLCDANGALLILDEVQCGLGRTGRLWAFEHYDIVPDIVVLGKGLSGGIYPISATVIRQPLEQVFHKDPFIHISTFGGSELGCQVMKKVLEISSENSFLNHVNTIAEVVKEKLEVLIDKHPRFFMGIRQKGLMAGLKLKDELCGPLLTKTAFDQGLLLVYANNDKSVCQFLPPLITTKEELDEIIPKLDKAMQEAQKLKPLLKVKNYFGNMFSKG
jgi:acetylornithine/succinyldiaminopimelate/putrescine aminotransferase